MKKIKESQSLKFARLILLIDAALLAVSGYPITVNFGMEMFISIILGFVVTSVAFITAICLIESNYQESINKFMSLVMGSMLGKLFFLSGAILFVFIFSFLHQIGFTIAVLISYLYKSVAEIIFINRISSKSRLPQ
ncbi:MAG: hypothetical protein WD267_07190 [Balneolales bacterium]